MLLWDISSASLERVEVAWVCSGPYERVQLIIVTTFKQRRGAHYSQLLNDIDCGSISMAESLEIIMLSNLLRGMWLIFGHLTYCTAVRTRECCYNVTDTVTGPGSVTG